MERRDFLKLAGTVALGAALPEWLAGCSRGETPTQAPPTGTLPNFIETGQAEVVEANKQATQIVNLALMQKSALETQMSNAATLEAIRGTQTVNVGKSTALAMTTVIVPSLETQVPSSTSTPAPTRESIIVLITDNEADILEGLKDDIEFRYSNSVLVKVFPSCGDLMDYPGYKQAEGAILDNVTGSEPSGIKCARTLKDHGLMVAGHDHSRLQNLIQWELAGVDKVCQKGDRKCIYDFLEKNLDLTPSDP